MGPEISVWHFWTDTRYNQSNWTFIEASFWSGKNIVIDIRLLKNKDQSNDYTY